MEGSEEHDEPEGTIGNLHRDDNEKNGGNKQTGVKANLEQWTISEQVSNASTDRKDAGQDQRHGKKKK